MNEPKHIAVATPDKRRAYPFNEYELNKVYDLPTTEAALNRFKMSLRISAYAWVKRAKLDWQFSVSHKIVNGQYFVTIWRKR